LLSKLDFASCYAYSPWGKSQESDRSRSFRSRLKKGDRGAIDRYAGRIAEQFHAGHLGKQFGLDATLVPVPGSAPLVAGALWIPMRICEALRERGLGGEITPIIQRARAVRKSAFQAGSERPSLTEHYESMAVDEIAPEAAQYIVVDDVVTSGCTMLAAASRLADAYPGIPVTGFAVARAMYDEEVESIVSPVVGIIRPSRNGRAYRRP
jgi:predicted amidophosphoribosyltransferase